MISSKALGEIGDRKSQRHAAEKLSIEMVGAFTFRPYTSDAWPISGDRKINSTLPIAEKTLSQSPPSVVNMNHAKDQRYRQFDRCRPR